MDWGTILDAFVLTMAIASALLLLYGLAIVLVHAFQGEREAAREPEHGTAGDWRTAVLD
jgi:hypothetical protein